MATIRNMLIGALFVSQALLAAGVKAAPDSTAVLLAAAKVTRAQANATALAKMPHGVVQSAELEREHGRLVWSLDVAAPSRKGVTEIQIDARSGKIVLMKKESAAQEARELKAELHEAK